MEQFLQEYAEAVGGLWEEVEPQVYDVLWPDADEPLRLTLDPEALPDHPAAQLLIFGNPLLDQLLEQAQARGRVALAYVADVHLTPHALDQRVQRDLTLPAGTTLQVEKVRPVYVTHTLFWFEATFVSDEKEEALYSVAVDRYYGRLARHLEPLLEGGRLSDTRPWPYPDAPSIPLERAYLLARERVTRTVTAEANSRRQEMQRRLAQQTERMVRYFADLREELQERLEKAQAKGEDTESLRLRLEALAREEAVRLEEMRRKAMLRAHLQLMNLLHLKAPRLFITARVAPAKAPSPPAVTLSLTWDPLLEKTDAVDCSGCQHPTYALAWTRRGELRCPTCAGSGGPSRG